eukprot:1457781-Prymnesium_polylepis.1
MFASDGLVRLERPHPGPVLHNRCSGLCGPCFSTRKIQKPSARAPRFFRLWTGGTPDEKHHTQILYLGNMRPHRLVAASQSRHERRKMSGPVVCAVRCVRAPCPHSQRDHRA